MHLPEYLTPEQYAKLYHHMPTNMMKDALKVMYVFALRISELCNLSAADVDFQRMSLTVNGKGSKIRQLSIDSSIEAELRQAVKRPGKLFNVEVRTFRNYIYLAAAKAAIGYCHPHMIRHSRATHLMNAGVSFPDIKAIMRHSSPKSTYIYTHVALDRMKSIMDANQLAL